MAASSGSGPAITASTRAASSTLRANGPAVSWLKAIGTMPVRDTSPTVGLMPTMPFAKAGTRIEPAVSVPIATGHRPAATAAADPELEVDTGSAG